MLNLETFILRDISSAREDGLVKRNRDYLPEFGRHPAPRERRRESGHYPNPSRPPGIVKFSNLPAPYIVLWLHRTHPQSSKELLSPAFPVLNPSRSKKKRRRLERSFFRKWQRRIHKAWKVLAILPPRSLSTASSNSLSGLICALVAQVAISPLHFSSSLPSNTSMLIQPFALSKHSLFPSCPPASLQSWEMATVPRFFSACSSHIFFTSCPAVYRLP